MVKTGNNGVIWGKNEGIAARMMNLRLAIFLLISWFSISLQSLAQVELVPPIVTSFESYNNESRLELSMEDGVITCWRSARKDLPYTHLYLQKTDKHGNNVWEADGTPVCPFPANQTNFSMVSDGYGGVVVVWEDGRKGNDHPTIYAQRINLRGEPLWGNNGLEISTSPGEQRHPKIVSDLKAGFYIVWYDGRKGYNEGDIYAQHVTLAGKLDWVQEGLPIVTHPRDQKNFTLASDEKNYLYVMWEDFRNGLYWNLYGQKLDRQGNFFWKAGGTDVFAGVEENHHNPSVVPDGYGGLIFVYQKYSRETQGYDIFRGRISTEGEVVYHFATCSAEEDQLNPKLAKRGSLAVICWEDKRNGDWDIYAQAIRIKDGVFEWELDGMPVVRADGDDQEPFVVASSIYNYQVFSWLKREKGQQKLFVQKLDNFGGQSWGPGGKEVCRSSSTQSAPYIADDFSGGLWVSWTDERFARTSHIFVQHVTSDGQASLDPKGVDLIPKQKEKFSDVKSLRILPAEDGDFFMAWEDYRNGTDNADIFIQKFDIHGVPKWRPTGIPVCLAAGEQARPYLVEDGEGGVIVIWVDHRNNLDDNIYAQRISANGKVQWFTNGVVVCQAPQYQGQIRAISDGSNGAIICWSDARSFMSTGFDLYIQRLSAAGEPLWGFNGKPLVNRSELQTSPWMASDGASGAYIVWADNRDGFSNIFAQHIDALGTEKWMHDGISLQNQNQHQRNPMCIQNFQGDLVVVWEDARRGEGNEKVYMQRLSANGSRLWQAEGVPVCNQYGRQTKPGILSDSEGNYWITWLDERAKSSVGVKLVAQQFSAEATPKWPIEGITLGSDLQENNEYQAAINKKGYAYFTWNQLNENGTHSAYYQKLSPEGTAKYGIFGYRLGGSDIEQVYPVIGINLQGRALVSWVQFDKEIANKSVKMEKVLE